jgi:hypothetical protein
MIAGQENVFQLSAADPFTGRCLFRQSVGKTKSSDLQDLLVTRGPEAKGFYATTLGHPMRCGSATFRSIRRLVELHNETFVGSLPAEDVRARRESNIGYCYGRLDEKIVRVFAVGGVPRSDKYHPRNDFAVRIHDS